MLNIKDLIKNTPKLHHTPTQRRIRNPVKHLKKAKDLHLKNQAGLLIHVRKQ